MEIVNRRYLRFFRLAESRARQYVEHPWKAARVVAQASRMSESRKAGAQSAFSRSHAGGQWQAFKALIRMLRAWSGGRYNKVPVRTVVFGIAALIYFVSPIDAIPDVIPVIGLLDDVTVIGFVLNAIRHDIERFREWEQVEGRTIEAGAENSAVS